MAAITVADLTEGKLTGTGVFDQLMQANKAHLEDQYTRSRIKGAEYATVYLGALQTAMEHSLQYVLQEQNVDLQAQLLEKQIETEGLKQAQLTEQTLNITAERAQIEAQTALAEQQKTNLTAEALNIPKQGLLLDAQTAVQDQQKVNLTSEDLRIKEQTAQITAETLNVPKQGDLLDAQTSVQIQQETNLQSEKLKTDSQTLLIDEQAANAVIEGTVLTGQKCKLDAEFDLISGQVLKVVQETALLGQKKVTEEAQTSSTKIDPDSVIGKQNALYDAQRDGYRRDAEQKVAKLMTDTWNVRKTMDDSTPVTGENKLEDSNIGEAIGILLSGIRSPAP